ncbi:MAG TPA: HAD-IA family hydrolase [bacterium]|nr:HAD-IA family hydrolase [bacterium]
MAPLLIFDLDGTLIDSKKDIANSLNFALEEEGMPTLPHEQIEALVGHGARTLVRDALGHPSEEKVGRVFQSFWRRYLDHCLDETHLYPGVARFLASHADWPMAVVTNKPEVFSQKILEGLKVRSHFRWLIGGDTLTVQKPDPAVFDPIFQEWRGEGPGLMVGDSHVDIECGRAAGLLTCAVTYGFRTREELVECRPDFLIESFSDFDDLPFFKARAEAME